MNTWFECKVRYEKVDEQTGKLSKITAPYLIDAVSYTEAEERIHKEMEQYVSGEFAVKGIKQVNYTDLFFFDDGDWWFKVKVSFITFDEASNKEKRIANMMLLMADDVKQAYERIDQSMKGTTVDYEIEGINKSNILDVFLYNIEDKAEELDGKSKAYKDE